MKTELSDRIRIILEEQHLKQMELAEALGVSANYISLLAGGKKTRVSLTLAKLLESLYGYSTEWVMTGEGVKNKAEYMRRQAMERIMKMDIEDLMKIKEFIE